MNSYTQTKNSELKSGYMVIPVRRHQKDIYKAAGHKCLPDLPYVICHRWRNDRHFQGGGWRCTEEDVFFEYGLAAKAPLILSGVVVVVEGLKSQQKPWGADTDGAELLINTAIRKYYGLGYLSGKENEDKLYPHKKVVVSALLKKADVITTSWRTIYTRFPLMGKRECLYHGTEGLYLDNSS